METQGWNPRTLELQWEGADDKGHFGDKEDSSLAWEPGGTAKQGWRDKEKEGGEREEKGKPHFFSVCHMLFGFSL